MMKKGLVRDGDFLDPISADKPDGCWTLGMDPSCSVAVLRSLAWPGYFFFHQVVSQYVDKRFLSAMMYDLLCRAWSPPGSPTPQVSGGVPFLDVGKGRSIRCA